MIDWISVIMCIDTSFLIIFIEISWTIDNGKYTLHDTSQDTEIETRSANSTESLSLPIINGSTNFNKDNQKAGVDAHMCIDTSFLIIFIEISWTIDNW